jgi:GGDEF domain-containing protein
MFGPGSATLAKLLPMISVHGHTAGDDILAEFANVVKVALAMLW